MKLYTEFTDCATKFPQATAVVYREKRLTYRGLDILSSRLARAMAENGFEPGQRAAIYLEKSADFIVCILATLKAGGIYVPLDFNLPSKRVSYILENCEISLLFARREKILSLGQGSLPETTELLFTVGDAAADDPFFTAEKRENSRRALPNEENLVFLLYTSGSTGVPKGVKISCQNARVFLDWCRGEMRFTRDDAFLNLAGFHFDLSVFDIFIPLSIGAKLVISPDTSVLNPFEIARAMAGATVLYCVPSVLALLLSSGAAYKSDLSSLRYVLFAGETFPIKYLRALRSLLPQASLYNLYGPTETNVCSYFKVGNIPEERTDPVPIGTAVSGATLYAVDEKGVPIQQGEVGELYVQGPCVTPGYYNYHDPRNAQNHERNIHATGDLVSLEDGNFVFHGRRDNQIKWRGYRIELDEIETVLVNHENVKEGAVIVVDREDTPRLVACVVPHHDHLDPVELKEYSRKILPRYMVPHIFKTMASLPKNCNGKTDRVKLRELLQGEEIK